MSARVSSDAVLAARSAVASSISDFAAGDLVIVACSGGPDSLALAGSVAAVARSADLRTLAVCVDHGLQDGSADVSAVAASTCRRLGVDEAVVVPVLVGTEGGPEAAARTARYAALESIAVERDASAVLLGHTRDDQAETVLLRLARGSGARSLSAMRARSGPWRRPFLGLARAQVHEAARDLLEPLGGEAWVDPHNSDPAFARVRVRAVLDDLTAALGPGAVLGLARSAELLRDDADALDAWSRTEFDRLVFAERDQRSADCAALAELPRALRTRVIRGMCLAAGSPADQLTIEHVQRVEAFVTDWRGQGTASLPSGVEASRSYGRLCLRSSTSP